MFSAGSHIWFSSQTLVVELHLGEFDSFNLKTKTKKKTTTENSPGGRVVVTNLGEALVPFVTSQLFSYARSEGWTVA